MLVLQSWPFGDKTLSLKGSIDQLSPECPRSINEAALVRKIDLRLLPMLFIVYVAAFLDRYVIVFRKEVLVEGI